MEKADTEKDLNKYNNGMCKNIDTVQKWSDIVTVISLSCENITNFEVKLPPNLTALDLSHNKLRAVPECVLNQDKIRSLNLSSNDIKYFDDTPKFLHSIVRLEINNNNLHGPPYWVWAESPENLTDLDISGNPYITDAFRDCEYYNELLQYTTKLTHIKIFNCKIGIYNKFFGTFPAAKVLEIGVKECTYAKANLVENIPGMLERSCQLLMLNLCNTKVFYIKNNIHVLKNLREINLSSNSISSVPEDFCHLVNLEICDLSNNKIIYLPDGMEKMTKLVYLILNNNNLCMLPDGLTHLSHLVMLDIYNNSIYEIPEKLLNELSEIDVAQNFFDIPGSEEYAKKKERLRLHVAETDRLDERKPDPEASSDQSSRSPDVSDVDEVYENGQNCAGARRVELAVPARIGLPSLGPSAASSALPGFRRTAELPLKAFSSSASLRASSESDWESDEYWVPRGPERRAPPAESPWMFFVKAKMKAGNFCPMDVHTVSITERVRYEKLCNPPRVYESDGQFDDRSDDSS